MFMMIYVVQSYEIDCIYMLISVESSGEASAEFCLPAWGKDIAKRLAKAFTFLLYKANLYFDCGSCSEREMAPLQRSNLRATPTILYSTDDVPYATKSSRGSRTESFILMEPFSLMQKHSWEVFFLSNKSIKVCILHIHLRTGVYSCGACSDF